MTHAYEFDGDDMVEALKQLVNNALAIKPEPTLYVFVRPFESMNNGKAQAHSGHTSNAFVFEHYITCEARGEQADLLVSDWMNQTDQGFGTQINLHGFDWAAVSNAVLKATEQGFAANFVYDPTYPYEVPSLEIAELISQDKHTADPIVRYNEDNTIRSVICFRREVTGAYIFGDKNALQPIVGGFELAP